MKASRDINLDTYNLSLLTAREDVLNPRSSTNWALFAYDGVTNRLKLADSGVGGVSELASKLHPRRPLYGLCTVGKLGTPQCYTAMIIWVGDGVDSYRRNECAAHVPAIKSFFKDVHVFLQTSCLEDITEEKICSAASKIAAKHRVRRVPLQEDREENVGTNYKRTIAAAEIARSYRESFWANAEKEEEERKEEELRRAFEERRNRERERLQQEKRDAEERERKMREKQHMIQEQRRLQALAEAKVRRPEQIKRPPQQEQNKEETRPWSARSESEEKAAEAAALVSQRKANPREFFRQLSVSSSSSANPNALPRSPNTARSQSKKYHRSLTDAFLYFKSASSTPTSPCSSGDVSPFFSPTPTPPSPTMVSPNTTNELLSSAATAVSQFQPPSTPLESPTVVTSIRTQPLPPWQQKVAVLPPSSQTVVSPNSQIPENVSQLTSSSLQLSETPDACVITSNLSLTPASLQDQILSSAPFNRQLPLVTLVESLTFFPPPPQPVSHLEDDTQNTDSTKNETRSVFQSEPSFVPINKEAEPNTLPRMPQPEPTSAPIILEPEPSTLPTMNQSEPSTLPIMPHPEPASPPMIPQPEPTSPPMIPQPEPTSPPMIPQPEPSSLLTMNQSEPINLPIMPRPEPSSTPMISQPDQSSLTTMNLSEPTSPSTISQPEPSSTPTMNQSEPSTQPIMPQPEPTSPSTISQPEPNSLSTMIQSEPSTLPVMPHPEPTSPSIIPKPEPSSLHTMNQSEPSTQPIMPHSEPTSSLIIPQPEPNSLPTMTQSEPSTQPIIPQPEPSSLPAINQSESSTLTIMPHPEPTSSLIIPQPEPNSLPTMILSEPSTLPIMPHPEPTSPSIIPQPEPSSLPTMNQSEPITLPIMPHPKPTSSLIIPQPEPSSTTAQSEPSTQPIIPQPEPSSLPTINQSEPITLPLIPRPEASSKPMISQPDQSSLTTVDQSEPTSPSTISQHEPSSTPTMNQSEPSTLPIIPQPEPASTPLIFQPESSDLPTVPEHELSSLPTMPQPEPEPSISQIEPDFQPIMLHTEPISLPMMLQTEPVSLPMMPQTDPDSLPVMPQGDLDVLPMMPQTEPDSLPMMPQTEPISLPLMPQTDPVSLPIMPQTEPDSLPIMPQSEPDSLPTKVSAQPVPQPPSRPLPPLPALLPPQEEVEPTRQFSCQALIPSTLEEEREDEDGILQNIGGMEKDVEMEVQPRDKETPREDSHTEPYDDESQTELNKDRPAEKNEKLSETETREHDGNKAAESMLEKQESDGETEREVETHRTSEAEADKNVEMSADHLVENVSDIENTEITGQQTDETKATETAELRDEDAVEKRFSGEQDKQNVEGQQLSDMAGRPSEIPEALILEDESCPKSFSNSDNCSENLDFMSSDIDMSTFDCTSCEHVTETGDASEQCIPAVGGKQDESTSNTDSSASVQAPLPAFEAEAKVYLSEAHQDSLPVDLAHNMVADEDTLVSSADQSSVAAVSETHMECSSNASENCPKYEDTESSFTSLEREGEANETVSETEEASEDIIENEKDGSEVEEGESAEEESDAEDLDFEPAEWHTAELKIRPIDAAEDRIEQSQEVKASEAVIHMLEDTGFIINIDSSQIMTLRSQLDPAEETNDVEEGEEAISLSANEEQQVLEYDSGSEADGVQEATEYAFLQSTDVKDGAMIIDTTNNVIDNEDGMACHINTDQGER